MNDLDERLCKRLGYTFKNEHFFQSALTHRSVKAENNERLEFLGDSVLNFVIAEEVYHRHPTAREGQLSRLRASLVKGETLAKVALEFDLGSHLHLGSGELKSGGHQRSSILADALEALIAAIYLDSDFDTCRQRIIEWFDTRLNDLHLAPTLKDPKTQLQEHLQARKMGLPAYSVSSVTGKAHDQLFVMKCEVQGLDISEEGRGKSRRRAEQAAAKAMLDRLLEKKNK